MGNLDMLGRAEAGTWGQLVGDARSRGLLVEARDMKELRGAVRAEVAEVRLLRELLAPSAAELTSELLPGAKWQVGG